MVSSSRLRCDELMGVLWRAESGEQLTLIEIEYWPDPKPWRRQINLLLYPFREYASTHTDSWGERWRGRRRRWVAGDRMNDSKRVKVSHVGFIASSLIQSSGEMEVFRRGSANHGRK